MPSNWLYVDTNFPSFTGKEPVNKKIDIIQNYLYVLLENLRYCLRNLDMSNMNQTELEKFTDKLTDPIYKQLQDAAGNITSLQVTAQGLEMRIASAEGDVNRLNITAQGLAAQISNAQGDITQLQATARGLSAQISNAQGDITQLQATAQGLSARIANAEGDVTQLQAAAQGLTARITNAEGDVTSLQATAQGLATRVGNAEGAVSTLQQTVNGFTLSASNGANSSVLGLYANGVLLSSTNIQITGTVTFTDLAKSGSTVINGDNITTGQILSQYIKLMGKLTVYDDSGYPGGYLGYMQGRTATGFSTPGIGFESLDGAQCLATTAGVRMSFGSAAVVVLSDAVQLHAGSTVLQVWDNGQVTVNNVPIGA